MFKKIVLPVLGLALFALSCGSGGNNDLREEARQSLTANTVTVSPPASGPLTSIAFDETEYNFGTVEEGEIVEHTYTFTNTGEEPLVIRDARGSCGCTVPDWPKEPIAQGETGEVKVRLNTANKKNNVRQTVTLTANTEPANTVIYIAGVVNPKAGAAQPDVQMKVNQ